MGRRIGFVFVLPVLALLPACRLMKSEPTSAEVVTITSEPLTQFAALPRSASRIQTIPPVTVTSSNATPFEPPVSEAPLPKVTLPNTPPGPRLVETPIQDPPLVAAVRAYLQERPDLAVEHLKGLEKPNQEMLLQLIPAIVRASQLSWSQARPHEIGLLMRELQGPMQQLALRGPLFIDKAVFVKSVKGFGRYEPLQERPTLKAGSMVGLYVEVGNVPSEPSDAEGFVTHLSCTMEVRDGNGVAVELADSKDRKSTSSLQESRREVTRSPMRDYFVASWFPVPSKPGSYTVSFEVRDVSSGRAISKSIPFRVQ
jgi:hypothetical protein